MPHALPVHLCLLLSLLLSAPFARADNGAGQNVLLQLPRPFLEEVIEASLPLELDTGAIDLEGSVVIETIEELELAPQQLSARLGLAGRQVRIITTIGNQQLRLQVGDIDLELDIAARIRFDPASQTLFITPRAVGRPTESAGRSGELGNLLAGLFNGREFPVTVEKLQPIIAELPTRQLLVDFLIGDISVTPETILLQLLPEIHTRPRDPPMAEEPEG